MNESAGDSNSIFGRAAGTAMGIGVGAAGVGGGIWMASKGAKPIAKGAVNITKKGIDKVKQSDTVAAIKQIQEDVASKSILENKGAIKGVQETLGEKLVNNMDDMGKSIKGGFSRILETVGKVK